MSKRKPPATHRQPAKERQKKDFAYFIKLTDPFYFLRLEEWTTDEVMFYFRICREQLRRWRKREIDPFPEPNTPAGCACKWSKTDVLAWAARNKKLREQHKAANDNEAIANDNGLMAEHECPVCGHKRR